MQVTLILDKSLQYRTTFNFNKCIYYIQSAPVVQCSYIRITFHNNEPQQIVTRINFKLLFLAFYQDITLLTRMVHSEKFKKKNLKAEVWRRVVHFGKQLSHLCSADKVCLFLAIWILSRCMERKDKRKRRFMLI